MGYETCEGCAEIEGGGPHTEPPRWAFGELPMGYETCEGCAEMQGNGDDDDKDYNDDGNGR